MVKNIFKNKTNKDDFKTYSMNSTRPKVSKGELLLKTLVYGFTFIVIAILLIIVIFVAIKSATVFKNEGFWHFIFTDRWVPGTDAAYHNGTAYFGIGGIIASTLMMLVIAMLFSVPLTLFSALFISEYLGKKTQKAVMTCVKLLAGVPSVVFGLFAIDQIGPMFVAMGAPTNGNMMTASFTLSFMALPTMLSLSFNALQNVPESYRLASLGLGVTKERTTFTVVRKAATPKIISAVIMGMARVIGETMAVILIAGNSAAGLKSAHGFDSFLFASIKTLAGTIGLEMLENAGPMHESALYAIGLILFILVIIINLIILLISNADVMKRKLKASIARKHIDNVKDKNGKTRQFTDYELSTVVKAKSQNKVNKTISSSIALFFMISSTIIVLAFIGWLVGVVVVKGLIGLGHIDAFVSVNGQAGIFASLFTTILLIISTLVFAIPLALGTAIYLSEFASKKSILTKGLRFTIDLLASTPSIIFGIFGLSVFIIMFKLPMSIFASSLTMAIVVIPMLTSNFEDALSQVPQSYREAAYSLGLTKAQTLFKVTMPNAMEGLATGIILAMAKIIGETAPIYLTMGTAIRMPQEGFMASGATLTTAIYLLTSEGGGGASISIAYLFSLVTILLVFGLNAISGSISFNNGNKASFIQRWKNGWYNIINFDFKAFMINSWRTFKQGWTNTRAKLSISNLKQVREENKIRKKIVKTIEKKGG